MRASEKNPKWEQKLQKLGAQDQTNQVQKSEQGIQAATKPYWKMKRKLF